MEIVPRPSMTVAHQRRQQSTPKARRYGYRQHRLQPWTSESGIETRPALPKYTGPQLSVG